MTTSLKHDSRNPPSPPRCCRGRARYAHQGRPRAPPHAVGRIAPAARSRDEPRAAAVSPAGQTYGAHAGGRAPAGGGAAHGAPAHRRRRGAATARRRPRGDPDVFRKLLSPAGVTPRRVSGVQLTEAILELVKGGAGIAVLARWAVTPHLKTGELTAVPLTRRGLERRWRAAMLRQSPLPLHLREFAGLLAAGPTLLSRRAVRT